MNARQETKYDYWKIAIKMIESKVLISKRIFYINVKFEPLTILRFFNVPFTAKKKFLIKLVSKLFQATMLSILFKHIINIK